MKIYYGIIYSDNQNILLNITDICLEKFNHNNIITIPSDDNHRASIFSDPVPYVKKNIYIDIDGKINTYDDSYTIKINLLDNSVTTISDIEIESKLNNIHSTLQFLHGNILDELPEQKMSVRYLTGDEKVLEIGGNIGRNTLVIASILKDSKNLVTMESDPNIAEQLKQNRDINNMEFHIESSALSNRKLIQTSWNTFPSEVLLDGYNWVNTITLNELKEKYNIQFDTLVLDCEGAFYYILMDMPEILDNINLIIMENDYGEIEHKQYIDEVLKKNGFYRDYFERGGWGVCYEFFFETWKR